MNLLEPLGVESSDLELEMESSTEDQDYAEKLLKSVGSQAGKLQV